MDRLLSVIQRITSIENPTFRGLCDELLIQIQKGTDSRFAFFGFLNKDLSAMKVYSWSKETMKECAVSDKPLNFIINQCGLWADAVREKSPVIENDFFKNRGDRSRLPKGHVPIKNLLSVPIFVNRKMVAVSAVANRDTDYGDEDIEFIKTLSETVFLYLENIRIKEKNIEEIQKRLKAEKEFEKTNFLYKDLFDSSPIGKILVDKNFNIVKLNTCTCTTTEYSESELLGCSLEKIIPRLDFRTKLIEFEEFSSEIHCSKKDGSDIYCKVNAKVHDENSYIIYINDITAEYKKRFFNETRLELIDYSKNHSLLELLQKTLDMVGEFVESPIGFYHFVEPDGKTLSLQQWSTATLEKFCKAEGHGMHYSIDQAGVWVDCVHRKKPVVHNDYESLPHKKGMPEGHAKVTRELVVPVLRNNKVVAILGVGNKPVLYNDLDIEIISYYADVTWEIVQKKKAYEDLKKSEAMLLEAQKLARMGNWEFDIKTQQPYWSLEMFKLFGIDAKQSVPNYDEHRKYVHPDDWDLFDKSVKKAVETGEPYNIEIRLQHPNGKVVWVNSVGSAVRIDGAIKKLIGTTQDITERKETEEALSKDRKLKAMGEVSAGIAHDFNNTLQSIISRTEVMLASGENFAKSNLLKVKETAETAAQRIKQITSVASFKRREEDFETIPVNKLISEVIQQFNPILDKLEKSENIDVKVIFKPGTESRIRGIKGEIQSVLFNLLKNSLEALPEGGEITVTTRKKNNKLFIEVSDSGIGMDEITASKIFEPFFTTKGLEKGIGIGLSGAYSIVKEHNGDIYIKNTEIEKGTTFELAFPVSKADIRKCSKKSEEKNNFKFRKLSFLWVDDEEDIRDMGKSLLEIIGHEADAAASGTEALSKLEKNKYDLVITDIGMAGMNGWELAEKIHENFPKVKIAVLSGWDAKLSNKELNAKGISCAIQKPITKDILNKKINEIINT